MNGKFRFPVVTGLVRINIHLLHLNLLFWWNRVVAVCPPGMAVQNAFGGQIETLERTVNFYRINGILRAGWYMAARVGEQRRDGSAVKVNRNQQDPACEF